MDVLGEALSQYRPTTGQGFLMRPDQFRPLTALSVREPSRRMPAGRDDAHPGTALDDLLAAARLATALPATDPVRTAAVSGCFPRRR
jgi:hypothetical protein